MVRGIANSKIVFGDLILLLRYFFKLKVSTHPIRGGGAVNDLAYLNDYELAALLCKRSVPVWVGIGHEKDRTILDEIAHRSFDTPSKVIAGIRNTISENVQQVQNTFQHIKALSQYQLTVYQSQNDQYMRLIRTLSHSQLSESAKTLDVLKDVVHYCAQQQVRQTKQHIDSLLKETLLQNPRHILNKGYAIVRHNGRAIRSIQQLNIMQNIQLELQDGTIQAEIVKGSQNE
ncbi:exodeoxyribonuclease VII large subunit, partial [Acinetobacter radioresistens]|uniref:exodeoxyribonuclease VII large subunit n=1 Tax=Acinetobacter radioresistens TaxID=40216 RepID=UPI00031E304D